MALIDWDESYSVKIASMDDQHKRLMRFINQLHEAMKEGKGREAVEKVLDGLVEYTRLHFGAEERLLKLHGSPDYEDQRRAHEALIKQVLQFKDKVHEGKAPLSQEVMSFLKDWLLKHIQGMDMKYGDYLKAKGVV